MTKDKKIKGAIIIRVKIMMKINLEIMKNNICSIEFLFSIYRNSLSWEK
jgi:hypothetical protein